MNVYRAQPWQQSPQERKYDAQRAYQEYLQQLRQQYENASRGVYNTISEQQANQQLASLGLNFATDAYQQALAQARISGDISELGMRQQQARDNMLMDMAQTRWQREQQRLGMRDDLTRIGYQRATSEEQSPYMRALRQLGGY